MHLFLFGMVRMLNSASDNLLVYVMRFFELPCTTLHDAKERGFHRKCMVPQKFAQNLHQNQSLYCLGCSLNVKILCQIASSIALALFFPAWDVLASMVVVVGSYHCWKRWIRFDYTLDKSFGFRAESVTKCFVVQTIQGSIWVGRCNNCSCGRIACWQLSCHHL